MTTVTGWGLTEDLAIRALRGAARPLVGAAEDDDPLLELVGDARFVLLGEASHGTHELYRERAQITKRLIREQGFTSPPSPSRPTGRMPLASTALSAASASMPRPSMRWRASGGSPPGCGATPTCSTSSAGSAPRTIYRPETERASHYFPASLPAQFDAVLHFDRTRAVDPLERTAGWEAGEGSETFPTGI